MSVCSMGGGGGGLCCTDSCQWRSDVSHWAHVRDYVRNWTEHSIMSRFLARLTNSVNVFSISNMLQQTVTGSKPCVGSRDGGRVQGCATVHSAVLASRLAAEIRWYRSDEETAD